MSRVIQTEMERKAEQQRVWQQENGGRMIGLATFREDGVPPAIVIAINRPIDGTRPKQKVKNSSNINGMGYFGLFVQDNSNSYRARQGQSPNSRFR